MRAFLVSVLYSEENQIDLQIFFKNKPHFVGMINVCIRVNAIAVRTFTVCNKRNYKICNL